MRQSRGVHVERLDRLWRALKVWRQIRMGPVSVLYRFRRTVHVSRNRAAGSSLDHAAATLRPLYHLVSPTVSGFAAPNNVTVPVPVDRDQSSEVAVLFGVGPGLGHSLANKLVASGLRVALVSRRAGNLLPLAAELNSAGHAGWSRIYSCDASDERGVGEVFDLVQRDLGAPGLVVFSMQKTVPGPAIDIEVEAFEECWRTNCLAGFIVARAAARLMKPVHRGSIILIGSTSGLVGREGHLPLAVGKFGLRALSQVMARELWHEGIHVAHVVIDADIHEPGAEDSPTQSHPNAIADVVYSIHRQPRGAWASEVDVRPWNERFWEHC